jgi:hypothetical protein
MPKRTPRKIIDTRTRNSATTISGITLTSPSGVSDHGLLLGLGDDDHSQYLLASGGRTLTGNLAASAGVTIDGIDISAHAANPAAHHAPATAGNSAIGISGQAISLALAANPGLAVSSGLTMGTPGTLSVSSSNALSGSAHAHAITSSSNPGAAASILASDASGYLSLVRIGLGMTPTKPLDVIGNAGVSGNVAAGSLSVTGAATVGQDFTVGANVLYVSQAGTRVGINRAPDQQFDLDVAGAIRGQYLIGKHAIQLSSAVGVWHYDGPAPYNLDFGGSDASHAGIGGTPSGGVIYRPGKYGKAVQIAPAATNLIKNPSLEATLTGYYSDSTGASLTQSSAEAWVGGYALRWQYGSSGLASCGYNGGGTLTPSTAYTFSVCVKREDSADLSSGSGLSLWLDATGGAQTPTRIVDMGGGWYRFTLTRTVGASPSSIVAVSGMNTGYIYYFDGWQLTQTAYELPYLDGALGTGHSWSGTAHASTSSRAGATLAYAADGLSAQAGTILMWVRLAGLNPAGGFGLFGSGDNADFDAYVWLDGSVVFRADPNSLTSAAGAVTPGEWVHLAFTWDAAENDMALYVNGAASTSALYAAATLGSTLHVGSLMAGSPYSTNGLIDEFVLTDYAMDAKLVRAIYESDAPVFVESSVFHWRSPSAAPIWVDEYGLWARSVTGNEILGVYGGDPRRVETYKSWGGINMGDNDVLIGRAAGGYIHWDDSAMTMAVYGMITATTGAIGGWTLGTTSLIAGSGANTVGLDSGGTNPAIHAGGSTPGTAPFRVMPSGAVTALNATIQGTITAQNGAIGGWTLGTTSLIAGSGANTVGLDSGGTNPAFYAGSATPGSAPFRVMPSGAVTATNATITGAITAKSGSITGPLTIGSSGGIYQGSGTFASPTTGLRIWNDSGVGRIAGYNGGVAQWYANTNGYFYSGSGTMRIGMDDLRLLLGTYDGDYDDYRFIRWVPSIDGADTAITDFNYRSDMTSWANTGSPNTVNVQISSRVNAAEYSTREARTILAANNWNGTALSRTEIMLRQQHSGDSYNALIRFTMHAWQMPRGTGPTGNPPSGFAYVWLDSASNALKMRDSGGTTRTATFS